MNAAEEAGRPPLTGVTKGYLAGGLTSGGHDICQKTPQMISNDPIDDLLWPPTVAEKRENIPKTHNPYIAGLGIRAES